MAEQIGQIAAAIDRIHARGRQQLPLHGKEENEYEAEEEGRHGNADEDEKGDDAISPAELAHGRDDARQNAEHRADDERGTGEDKGCRKAFEHFIEDGAIEDIGAPEIALEEIA